MLPDFTFEFALTCERDGLREHTLEVDARLDDDDSGPFWTIVEARLLRWRGQRFDRKGRDYATRRKLSTLAPWLESELRWEASYQWGSYKREQAALLREDER